MPRPPDPGDESPQRIEMHIRPNLIQLGGSPCTRSTRSIPMASARVAAGFTAFIFNVRRHDAADARELAYLLPVELGHACPRSPPCHQDRRLNRSASTTAARCRVERRAQLPNFDRGDAILLPLASPGTPRRRGAVGALPSTFREAERSGRL